MKTLLLNRWFLLALSFCLLCVAPFSRLLVYGVPDAIVGALASSEELATLAADDPDPIASVWFVGEQESVGKVSDLQILADDEFHTRVSLKLRGVDGGGGYPTLTAWMRSADNKLLGTQVFAPGEYPHGSRLTIEPIELSLTNRPGMDRIGVLADGDVPR